MPMYRLSIIEKKKENEKKSSKICYTERMYKWRYKKKKVVGIPISNDYSFVVGVSEFFVSEEKKMKQVHCVFK